MAKHQLAAGVAVAKGLTTVHLGAAKDPVTPCSVEQRAVTLASTAAEGREAGIVAMQAVGGEGRAREGTLGMESQEATVAVATGI